MFDIKKITKNIFSKPNKKKYKAYEERVEKINL
jgi:hypothetical protein